MKTIVAPLVFAAGTRSLSIRHTGCCFNLAARGGPANSIDPVCAIGDGQLRIAQSGLQPARFCLSPDGGLTDEHGRGCILTDVDQFQCDAGKAPFGGFSFNCAGHLSHGQDDAFYACPTGDHGGYNLYTAPVQHQDFCSKIVITSDDAPCKPDCHPPPSQHEAPRPIPTCPVNSEGACVLPPSPPPRPSCDPKQGNHGCLPPPALPPKVQEECSCPPGEACDCNLSPPAFCGAENPKDCLPFSPKTLCHGEHCPPFPPKETCTGDRCVFYLGVDVFAQCDGETCTVFDDFGWLAERCKDGNDCPFPSKPKCDWEHDKDCIVAGAYSMMFARVPKSAVKQIVKELEHNYVKALAGEATA